MKLSKHKIISKKNNTRKKYKNQSKNKNRKNKNKIKRLRFTKKLNLRINKITNTKKNMKGGAELSDKEKETTKGLVKERSKPFNKSSIATSQDDPSLQLDEPVVSSPQEKVTFYIKKRDSPLEESSDIKPTVIIPDYINSLEKLKGEKIKLASLSKIYDKKYKELKELKSKNVTFNEENIKDITDAYNKLKEQYHNLISNKTILLEKMESDDAKLTEEFNRKRASKEIKDTNIGAQRNERLRKEKFQSNKKSFNLDKDIYNYQLQKNAYDMFQLGVTVEPIIETEPEKPPTLKGINISEKITSFHVSEKMGVLGTSTSKIREDRKVRLDMNKADAQKRKDTLKTGDYVYVKSKLTGLRSLGIIQAITPKPPKTSETSHTFSPIKDSQ